MNAMTSVYTAYAVITILLWGYALHLFVQFAKPRNTRTPE